MFGLILGFVIGATVATNYNLMPVYNQYIKPGVDLGLKKLQENTNQQNIQGDEEN